MKAKKLLSLLLALCLMAALLAGCDNGQAGDDTPSDSNSPTGSSSSETEMPAYKVGIISHTNSGGCWERILDAAEYMGGELNCEVSAAVGSSADAILTEAENFIASGVDGLIIMNDGGVTSRLVDLCEEAGVYIVFSDCGLSVVEEDDYSTYATSEYYLGHVAHDEYDDSYACAQDMIANGAENFVIFGLPPGISANFDKRAVGAMDAITDARPGVCGGPQLRYGRDRQQPDVPVSRDRRHLQLCHHARLLQRGRYGRQVRRQDPDLRVHGGRRVL